MTDALGRSPLVARVRAGDSGAGSDVFYVDLRDSAGTTVRWNGRVERATRADSAGTLNVGYTWLGYARPEPGDAIAMESAATRLLGELRAACAPSAPAEQECVRTGPFYEKPCSERQ